MNVNYTAIVNVENMKDRIIGTIYNSSIGHVDGTKFKTQPINSFKVVNKQVYAETNSCVYLLNNISPKRIAEMTNKPIYISSPKTFDSKYESIINKALYNE